jgi:hypothetical protein
MRLITRFTILVVLFTVSVLGGGAAAASAEAPVAEPDCFGAEARDPRNPCSSPSPAVFPTLENIDGDFVGGSACAPVPGDPAPICAFGVARSKAKRTFALLGDSHALHWRRAIDVVALAERWRGYSITTAGCPFSEAVNRLPRGGLRDYCRQWYRTALAFLRTHPEVSVVITSSFAPMPMEVDGTPSGGGKKVAAIKIAGYKRTWKALPRTVEHVIHIRDNPLTNQQVFDCVQRVIAEGTQPPAVACAALRRFGVRWDNAVTAARQLRSRRYSAIDLTEFFCDERLCYPVVGGARVYRDPFGHLTTAYSRTLGPFLHRKLRALMRRW